MSKSSGAQKELSGSLNIYRLVRLIVRFSGNTRRMFAISALMIVFEAMTATLIPLLVAYIIDYLTLRLSQMGGQPVGLPPGPLEFLGLPAFMDPDLQAVVFVTVGIIGMTMINRLGNAMAEIYLARGGRRIGFNLRMFLYAHLQKLSLSFYTQSRTAEILSAVTSDVAAVEDFILSDLSDLLKSVLLIIFILVSMLLNDWQVAVVAAGMIPVMGVVTHYYTNRIHESSQKLSDSESELASTAHEKLNATRVVQMYGQGSYEQALFSAESQKSMDLAVEATSYEVRLDWVVSVVGAVFTVAVIWMGVYLTFRNPLSLGSVGILAAYVRYIQDMFDPARNLIEEWSSYVGLSTSLEGIGEILDLKPAVSDEPGAIPAPQFRGHIEYRNVDFAYPAIDSSEAESQARQPGILKKINIEIQPGQAVAVVGSTGAGKSTIVQLIPRLYDPNSGQILIDGRDIRAYTLESLRSQISIVLQETILFSGSIVENIAYGRPEATGAEIIEAAKAADADAFISRLQDGYFTILGERGLNLSDGQRQQIAIARAFIRNTPILILDDPTTGLDAESTGLVLHALDKLMIGKTTLLISHELSLIHNADKIIVLKGGEVEQTGTHAELIQAGGLYADLVQMQSERDKARS